MATKKEKAPVETSASVNAQIREYCKKKAEASVLERRVKELGDKLKASLLNSGKREYSTGRYSIQLEVRKEEKVDTGKMLAILKNYWAEEHGDEMCPFIRTVEVIDEDALERFLYNHPLPEDTILALDSCRTTSTTNALKYKIAKEDK